MKIDERAAKGLKLGMLSLLREKKGGKDQGRAEGTTTPVTTALSSDHGIVQKKLGKIGADGAIKKTNLSVLLLFLLAYRARDRGVLASACRPSSMRQRPARR